MDTGALGRYLRETRETRELTLEQAVSSLRIRRGILEAFEQGDFTGAGSPVQVRGLLRNYARYLGLDEERILQYYEAAVYGQPRRRWGRRRTAELPAVPRNITDTPPSLPAVPATYAERPATLSERPATLSNRRAARRGRSLLGTLLTGLISLVALGIVLYVIQDMLQQSTLPAPEAAAVASPTPGGAGTPTATYTASWTPLALEATVTPLPPPGLPGSLARVRVELTQRSWLVLTVDGEIAYEGMAAPGYYQEVEAAQAVDIRAANAAGLQVTLNGQPRSDFGERGQEVLLRVTQNGIEVLSQSVLSVPAAPPPEATATVTATAPASATVPPTLTPFVMDMATESAPADVPVSDSAPLTAPTSAGATPTTTVT
nr:helix-turn-helix domain-containing protein [Anaerolineae bacterium]